MYFYVIFEFRFQILYDYTIRFTGEEFLIKKWPKLMIRIFKLLSKIESEECTRMGFDDQTTSFLMLLRQFSMKKTFSLNVEKFIVYSNVMHLTTTFKKTGMFKFDFIFNRM